MASVSNGTDMVALMRAGLEGEVKKQIEDDIVGKYVLQAESEIRAVVKERLVKYTFERIETWRELLELRDRIAVEITIGEDTSEKDFG